MPRVKRSRRIDIVLNRKKRKNDIQVVAGQKLNNDMYPSKQSRQADGKSQALSKMLKDKKFLAAFRSFLQSEFSEENIEFWLACEDFRSTTSADDLSWKAEKIYQEFIQPAAGREINVDHQVREKIKQSLKEPTTSCFDEAQTQVYLLMERDSCPRFLSSNAYLSLKRKSRTMWYI